MLALPSHEAHVWCVRLDLHPASLARLYATLSRDERRRSAGFRCPRDRRRFIAAHGLLRELLGRYLQTPADRIGYVCNAFGKPELGAEFGGRLQFNLSHSAGLALIAIAADARLGVDVERLRARADDEDIARCFFSAPEIEQLAAVPTPLRAEAFLGLWTKKEAYVKACGQGLAMPLDGFSVPPTTDPAQGPVDLDMASDAVALSGHWSIHTLRPAPGYIGALAIEGVGWRTFVHSAWRR